MHTHARSGSRAHSGPGRPARLPGRVRRRGAEADAPFGRPRGPREHGTGKADPACGPCRSGHSDSPGPGPDANGGTGDRQVHGRGRGASLLRHATGSRLPGPQVHPGSELPPQRHGYSPGVAVTVPGSRLPPGVSVIAPGSRLRSGGPGYSPRVSATAPGSGLPPWGPGCRSGSRLPPWGLGYGPGVSATTWGGLGYTAPPHG